jgi:glucan phosphoethanolaminetransferase (alkaline phosphatase superfamily)
MPQNKSSQQPPKVMTWPQASKTLVVAGIFDALRYFFLMFWLFAPVIAVVYCTAEIDGVVKHWTAGILGTKTAAAACTAAVGGTIVGLTVITGGLSAEAVEIFGTIMAMVVGFLGWLIIVVSIVMTDARTFKENPTSLLWIFAGLTTSIFLMTWRVYARQIKVEKAAYKKWEAENAAQLKARAQQIAAVTQAQQMQQVQAEEERLLQMQEEEYSQAAQEQAANDEIYDETQSPEKLDNAA